MRYSDSDDRDCVVLMTGCHSGHVAIYLSHPLHIQFKLHHRFKAHDEKVAVLHIHPLKSLFVSASKPYINNVYIWSWRVSNMKNPVLIKTLPQPSQVLTAQFSKSGLLLTGCLDGTLRVYEKEPLYAIRSSLALGGFVHAVSWSPSNRIAATYARFTNNRRSGSVTQIWTSSFETLFRHTHNARLSGVVFTSSDALLCSLSSDSISTVSVLSKDALLKAFISTNSLPFCTDVLKIIVTYLAGTATITDTPVPEKWYRFVPISSQTVAAFCMDDKLRLYKVADNKASLLGSVEFVHTGPMAVCPFRGMKELLMMLVSLLCIVTYVCDVRQ